MNPLIPLVLAAMTASSFAADVSFYLGTYTQSGKSKGIYLGKLNTETGKLGPLEVAGAAASPSFVALSPDGKSLYASLEDGGGAVGAFSVGPGGLLKTLNAQPSGGPGACHVWVDATGRTVFVANYDGGSIAAFRAQPDGSLGERTAFVQYEGTGPNKDRQEKPHAHSIYTDPENHIVFSCDLGTDSIWTFKFDAEKGTLTPANPPAGKVPAGSGPRHLALHPNGRFAYVNGEMAMNVTAFTRDAASGVLTPFQTLSTLPEGANPTEPSTAEIFVHPNGKWLYVSNRGHDSIAVYAIAADGRLTWLEAAPSVVKTPRGFAIDPTGHWIIAGGQDDDRIVVLKIDQETGKLTATDQTAEVGSPVCVLFVPAK